MEDSANELKTKETGLVFNVQRFSLDDGPGIRTTLFLKGCNYNCLWCHNPESIRSETEMLDYSDRCTGCGRCVAACPLGLRRVSANRIVFDRHLCTACSACARVCPSGAIVACGQMMTVDQAVHTLLRDKAFYSQSRGGVTFSGGEPMLQRGFVTALAEEMKRSDVHTALDTAGNVPEEWFDDRLLSCIDLFLYDVKGADPTSHKQRTGATNERSVANLRLLASKGARIWIRIPYIPGLTCEEEEIRGIAELLRAIGGIDRVELVPYHAYGESKYAALSRPLRYTTHAPERAEIEGVLSAFARHGLAVGCAQLETGEGGTM